MQESDPSNVALEQPRVLSGMGDTIVGSLDASMSTTVSDMQFPTTPDAQSVTNEPVLGQSPSDSFHDRLIDLYWKDDPVLRRLRKMRKIAEGVAIALMGKLTWYAALHPEYANRVRPLLEVDRSGLIDDVRNRVAMLLLARFPTKDPPDDGLERTALDYTVGILGDRKNAPRVSTTESTPG